VQTDAGNNEQPTHEGTVTPATPNEIREHLYMKRYFFLLNQCFVGSSLVSVEYCVARRGRKKLKINENSEEGYSKKERDRGE